MYRRKLSTILAGIIVAIFAIIALYGIVSLGKYYLNAQLNASQNNQLQSQFHTNDGNKAVPTPVPDSTEPTDLDDDTKRWLKDKYDEMHDINSDYCFWLDLVGLEQEYPVCYERDDPYYYLEHDFYGKENSNGCIYLSKNCDLKSENFILYGHCMHTGQMFGSLHKYLDEDFAKQNRLICIYMENEYRWYEVVSVFTCDMSSRPFNWERYADWSSPGAGIRFGQMAKDASFIDFGYDPQVHADRFLTLVTCEYTHNDGRLIVIARELGRPSSETVDWSDYD